MEDKTMKSKQFSKKLVLKRNTIANLTNHELRAVQGGLTLYCTLRSACVTDCAACPSMKCP